jgi:hypothetical protein
MIRANDMSACRVDTAHAALWERATVQQQRAIERGFLDRLGGDLACEADDAIDAATAAHYEKLGRWVASSWIEYRNERLDELAASGKLG